jgi:hypothetical protein
LRRTLLSRNISYTAPAVNGFSSARSAPDEVLDGPVIRLFLGLVEIARRQFARRAVVSDAVAAAAFSAARFVRAVARGHVFIYFAFRHRGNTSRYLPLSRSTIYFMMA